MLGGAIGGLIGIGAGYLWPEITSLIFFDFKFAFNYVGVLTTINTYTVIGVGSCLGVIYMIPMQGLPNSKISDGRSFGEYDSNGNLLYRVDVVGKSHYIKSIRKSCLPHKHQFTWRLVNGVWRFIEEVLPYFL